MSGLIVVAVGLPGAGKSTYFRKLGITPLSSDAVRLQLAGDEADQSINAVVFERLRAQLEQRLDDTNLDETYIDATNLTRRDRRPWIEIARRRGCEIEALYFDVPLNVCQERNASRPRVVPARVLELMAARLIPPSIEEGFSRVRVAGALPEKSPAGSTG